MNYKEIVDLRKDQVIHTIQSLNDAFHLSAITVGNLIASVPEYFALANTGHQPALSATFALASVVTATLSATIGGRMGIAFPIQVSVSIGTVWLNGGRVEASWPLVTAIVAISVSEYQKFSKVEKKVDSGIEFEQSLEKKKLDQKHEQAMARIRSKSDPNSVNRITDSPDWITAENMRENGISLRKISESTGIPYSTVQRHFKNKSDPSESLNESVNHSENGAYAP